MKELSRVKDPRHQSYTDYDIEEILYTVMLKNIFSLLSMQEMTNQFNQEERVQNVCKILGKRNREYLPHYVTINDCLKKLNPEELEKVKNKLIRSLIRKRSFENVRFFGNTGGLLLMRPDCFISKKNTVSIV